RRARQRRRDVERGPTRAGRILRRRAHRGRDVAELNPVLDHRIRVSQPARVRTADGEHDVTVLAMSGRTALLLAKEPLGIVGRVIDLWMPGVDGAELEITAGIERIERVPEGEAVAVHFMIAEPALRRAINDLLARLLTGDGGGTR